LASGSASLALQSPGLGLMSGGLKVGLGYRSGGSSGYQVSDPSDTLPGGWTLTSLASAVPWYRLEQSGSGGTPGAVVLKSLQGGQLEYTNTVSGSGGGSWAPPTQTGWPHSQFGALSDSGGFGSDSTFTWVSGQQVATFKNVTPAGDSGGGVWVVDEVHQVMPGGDKATGLDIEWDTGVDPVRVSALTDPVSGKSVRYVYGDSGSCDGTDGPSFDSVTYSAPTGLLCGWSFFDGEDVIDDSTTNIWYVSPQGDVDGGAVSSTLCGGCQVGMFVAPGGATRVLEWESDATLSTTQLRSLITVAGWDALAKGVAGVGEADTQWVVNYDQFGNVASVVSPKPSVDSFVSAADNDRLARTYSYNHSNEGNWSQVHWGVLADMGKPTQVAKGAIYLTETVFDGAWRPLRAKDAAGRESFQVWDTVNDRLIGQVSPNQKMKSRVYDYLETDGDPSKSTRLANLGRETQTWGPAPQSWFPVSKDSLGNLECDNPCRPTGSHGIKDVTAVQQLFDTGDNNALGGLLATVGRLCR
jgi:hypothetical protein